MKLFPSILGLPVLFSFLVPALAQTQPATVRSILQEVARTYAECKSYQDEGVVLSHYPDKPGPDEITFRTAFTRSGRFRFDWISHHPHPPLRHLKTSAVIWSDDRGAHMFTDFSNTPDIRRDHDTIEEAIKAAMGVSRRSSFHVPRLLMPSITGASILDLSDLTLVGDDVFEGVLCHRLKGNSGRGGTVELWVGQADFFLRRIFRQDPGVPPLEEIRRNITTDGAIPAGVFNVKI